jgi:hypothetical protein
LVTGAAAGALIGWATYEEPEPIPGEWNFDFGPGFDVLAGGILGAPAGFLLGGMIGLSAGKDETYDFTQMSYPQKLAILGLIVSNQK